MDEIKLFVENEKRTGNTYTGSEDIIRPVDRDGIWQRKMCYANKRSEKRQMTEGKEQPNQEKIRTLGEKETYKYLEIFEKDNIKQAEMKEKNLKKSI